MKHEGCVNPASTTSFEGSTVLVYISFGRDENAFATYKELTPKGDWMFWFPPPMLQIHGIDDSRDANVTLT